MNQIELLRDLIGGVYIAVTGALDRESAAYAHETLLAFADDAEPITAEVYRSLVDSVAEYDAPPIAASFNVIEALTAA